MIELIKAFRTSENEVCVMYRHVKTAREFVVFWNNIHAGTGEIVDYDLQLKCLSDSENFNDKVVEAIRHGETGENDELYIAIRDSFDAQDCESLE